MSNLEVSDLDKTLDEAVEEYFNEEENNQEFELNSDLEDDEEIEDNEELLDDQELSDNEILENNSDVLDDEDDENVIELTFEQLLDIINEKYMVFLNKVYDIFKNHEMLSKSISFDIKYIEEKLESNKYYILTTMTDNYLYCLEQIKDKNSDFFVYQKEKVVKKKSNSKGNIKLIKSKVSKIGNKTTLKEVLKNLKRETIVELFNEILEIFKLLIYEDEDVYNFHDDYLEFIKENFSNNKNYNKMCIVIDNIDLLIGSLEEDEIEEQEYQENYENNNKNKEEKKKSKKNKDDNSGEDFIKGIENTKIAKMAKNISEKIDLEEFPILTDPSKLLSTLTNPEEGLGSIGGLMDVVMKEVQSSFQEGNDNEGDLINEAQNIMGKLSGTNLDPVNLMKNMNLDVDKMAEIFSNKK